MSSDAALPVIGGTLIGACLLYFILALCNGHAESESGEIVGKEVIPAYTEVDTEYDAKGRPIVRSRYHNEEYRFVVRRNPSGDGDFGGELQDRSVDRAEYYGLKCGDTFKWTRWAPDWTFWNSKD